MLRGEFSHSLEHSGRKGASVLEGKWSDDLVEDLSEEDISK